MTAEERADLERLIAQWRHEVLRLKGDYEWRVKNNIVEDVYVGYELCADALAAWLASRGAPEEG